MRLSRIFRTTGFRLAALYGALFGLSVSILFAAVYWIAGDTLRHQLGAAIGDEVTDLAADHGSDGLPLVAATIERRLASKRHSNLFYLLLDAEGRKVAGDLPPLPPRAGWFAAPMPAEADEDAADDREVDVEHRLMALGVTLPDGSYLVVGADTYPVVELEEAIARAFAWSAGITIILATFGGSVLSFGFLRRIDAINRTSRAIIGGRLTERVPTRGTGDELDQLAVNLNEMLDSMQSLMESLGQVSNDIAHDLRTPLSRLRQRLEQARHSAKRMEDYEAVVDRAIADTDRILATFSALLRIAQIEAGSRKKTFSIVDLSAVFQSIADTYSPVAEDQGRSLDRAIEPGIRFYGDRELLMQMLANLVENAIRHTPAGTRISMTLARGPDRIIGVVADNGAGIPPEAREKVFRRFFRLERSRSTPGHGLGLSLVAAVAKVHGMTVTLVDNEPGLKAILDSGHAAAVTVRC